MTLYQFYRSDAWEKLVEILRLERVDSDGNVICAYCGKPITRKYDCIGHHVTELTEDNCNDVHIALNPENIILVHHGCHNKIHNRLAYSQRQVFLVYGSPLSGKTSYVRESMNEGDLIIDMDSIYEAISGQPRYIKPNRLKTIAFGVRDNLIEAVKYRKGKWLNAYVIGGYPYEAERNRLAEQLGARLIHIDTDKEECLKRLELSEDGRDKDEWKNYIEVYFLQSLGGY